MLTQNIDGLDYQALDEESIIPVHGSLGIVECEGCKAKVDLETFSAEVETNIRDIYGKGLSGPKVSTPILCTVCGKPLVKPATVLYGRNLPAIFFEALKRDLPPSDALVVVGTSLTVSPANTVPYLAGGKKILVNQEAVHESFDCELLGTADVQFAKLARELGWLEGQFFETEEEEEEGIREEDVGSS